jgi:hypothetical protein
MNTKAPVKKDQAPVKKDKAPVKADQAPVKADQAPVKKDKAPVKKDHDLSEINIKDYPPDFWKPHTPSDPKTLFDSKTNENSIKKNYDIKKPLLLFKDIFSIDLIKNGSYIDVRGNGLCGLYAIMWSIFKQYTEIHDIDHELFLKQILPIMKKFGILDERPKNIDADVLCNIMEEYLKIYYPYIMYPSFVIFSLSDVTYKFKFTKIPDDCNDCTINLFTIVHCDEHFQALYYPHQRKKDIYEALVKDFT